jgi:hypothetical protein
MFSIPFRGTKIEANSWNSVPNHSAEEKTSRNPVPYNKNKSKFSEFCTEAFRRRKFQKKTTSEVRTNHFGYFGCFVKLILSCEFRSVLSVGIDSSVDLGMSTFLLRITETVLILFAAEFFWNEIPFFQPLLDSKLHGL